MKVQCTLIIRTFRGMVLVSRLIPAFSKSLGQTQPITFHPTSAFGPINPNTFAYSTINPNIFARSSPTWESKKEDLKRVVDSRSEYNIDGERDFGENVPSVNAKRAIAGSSENGHDEGSRAFPKFHRPRPQQVPWQDDIANTVHLTGAILRPVKFNYTDTGRSFAWSLLGVKNSHEDALGVKISHEDDPMWFGLLFWDRLAEAALQQLKKNNRVYVSGCLTSTIGGENDKRCIFYKLIVNTVRFVPRTSVLSHQVVVNENTPSAFVSQPTLRNGVTSFQNQQSPIEYFNSGNKTGATTATIERLWSDLFANPDSWRDNRWDKKTNQVHPNYPDFRHKVTGAGLWISRSPSWVKRELGVWDPRMKDPKE